MSEDAAIRRENLRHLVAARKWGAKDLSAHVGGRYTYWRDMLQDPRKGFGENAARKIEDKLELPRGWLDQPGAAMHGCAEPTGRYSVPRWPWDAELYRALSTAAPEVAAQCEAVLRVILRVPPAA
jgi:hypothetical protein